MNVEGLRRPYQKFAKLYHPGRIFGKNRLYQAGRFIGLTADPTNRAALVLLAAIGLATAFCNLSTASASAYVPFDGEKTTWRDGFDRYDYFMDETSFAITPFKRPQSEKFAVGSPPKGQRRCIVVAPRQAASGYPWSWQGCYWDHEPQTEVELLRRGFHI